MLRCCRELSYYMVRTVGQTRTGFPGSRRRLRARDSKWSAPVSPRRRGNLSAWFEAQDLAVQSLSIAPTILVGHSLGAAFALRLIERAAEPVAGVLLAAGFVGALAPSPSRLRPDQSIAFFQRRSTGRRFVNAREEYSDAGREIMTHMSRCLTHGR
ncbi:alpha/beta fold hydrolase [Rhizobium beringeri]|uniref:alpha/beta fold hydrolase n=1 Tax=Rhizobium beringeri TaxID=3019934 RepID=UPI003990C627